MILILISDYVIPGKTLLTDSVDMMKTWSKYLNIAGFVDREPVASRRALWRAQRGSGDQVRSEEDAVAGDGALLRVLVPHHVRHVRRDDLRHRIPRRLLLRHHSTRHAGQYHFILALKGLWM